MSVDEISSISQVVRCRFFQNFFSPRFKYACAHTIYITNYDYLIRHLTINVECLFQVFALLKLRDRSPVFEDEHTQVIGTWFAPKTGMQS